MSRKYAQLLNNSDFVCFLFLFHKNKFDETMCYIRKLSFINFPLISVCYAYFLFWLQMKLHEIQYNLF
jgi:hypothetical protein